MNKKMMYTVWTEDEGCAEWVTEDREEAQKIVDKWYEDYYKNFGYENAEEFRKNINLAYVVEVN